MINPLDCKVFVITDKNNNEYLRTSDTIRVIETLASLNDDVLDDMDVMEDYYDSISGYHCKIYDDYGDLVCIYGGEGSILCHCRFITPDEVFGDMKEAIIAAEGLILDNKLYIIKDAEGNESCRTENPFEASEALATANLEAIREYDFEDDDEDKDYDDFSASGYLCEIYSAKKGDLICVYGEEGSRMYGFQVWLPEDIRHEMAEAISDAKLAKMYNQ